MKIRQGFVSNSSSSSFVVGFQKGLPIRDKKKLLYEKMGVNKNSFFYIAANEIVKCILDSDRLINVKDVLEHYGYDSMDTFSEDYGFESEIIKRVFANGMDVYVGSATNEGYEVGEALFCDMEWFADDKDFMIAKEAGF